MLHSKGADIGREALGGTQTHLFLWKPRPNSVILQMKILKLRGVREPSQGLRSSEKQKLFQALAGSQRKRPGPLQQRQHKMSPDLKGIRNKGTAGVKQNPWTETREAMLISED